MFTNGSTARECGGGLKGAAVVAATLAGAGAVEIQNRSATKYASAANKTTMSASQIGFDRQGGGTGTAGALGKVAADGSDDNSRPTRSTKAAGVSPAGNRVHCNSRNLSGTCSSSSGVASMATGNRNALVAVIKSDRSTASFHSRRK